MANVIATLLTAPKTINITETKGPQRHAYNELLALQAKHDPALAPPYVAGDSAITIAANGGTTGNFTITMNFPKYNVSVTTGNILYNSANAAIQTLVDSALAGEVIVATYVADDAKIGLTVNASSGSFGISANGTTVANTYMIVTTANVDMDVAAPAVTVGTIGTGNRPAEAVLALYGAITPSGDIAPQGTTPATGAYVVGDNPMSLSPGLQLTLVNEITAKEDATIGRAIRAIPDCVG
jgi:hypothetical protein